MLASGQVAIDRISYSKLYEKGGSVLNSSAIIREILWRLGRVLPIKDNKLQTTILFGRPSWAKRSAGRLRMEWEEVARKDLMDNETSLDSVKREAMEWEQT